MSELPTGTVSLLFSDIEGSTVLLSRLGAAYAEALDGQRLVLRKAWAEHGGIELGTEGDSFYVVFPTAPAAVAAAVQAQRELAVFEWPAGERVRVRMGIHTGNPTVHDGAYVGMDVHRAARIAGSAHGGQVVVSQATAHLVDACLPNDVALRDLGSHKLKDIAAPEHLFQLVIDGLASEFPPIKTLGAASSLPRPATPLVGRDGELAELTALVGSPEVRLVTLTGPGGTGKTRLAIALAQQLVERFPDGVYFVPLAAVTTADVMWTTIAEVLDVPPEGRIPPGFFEHVVHRTALFVLDNLEQIDGADAVVAELLDHAPQVVAVATSRKPLAVAAQHAHPVPPLELPEDNSVEHAQASGAVQLFVQHARKVKPSSTLTADNVADVIAVCRRLDGLPLAIELAAARTRLLTPKALLARLDQALDIKAAAVDQPTRQKTLRDTIGWSHDLLTDQQQAFFRRLGVFSGGADLDAVTAVIGELLGDIDPFDLVADLVDASLLTIGESFDGEPRVGMLETIRAFAVDQLTSTGEIDMVSQRHAEHYLRFAEDTRPLLFGERYAEGRARFETEHDNLRQALAWALQPDATATEAPDRTGLGLRLCLAMGPFRGFAGYHAEQRRWSERAVEQTGGGDSVELARCLSGLSRTVLRLGDLGRAREYATASVNMWRRLGDTSRLAISLISLADIEAERGQVDEARALVEEAITAARTLEDMYQLVDVLSGSAAFEASQGNFEQSLALNEEALRIAQEMRYRSNVLTIQHNMACVLRQTGRLQEAKSQMRFLIPQVLDLNEPDFALALVEDYAAVLAEYGDHSLAVRLVAAADATRERNGIPRPPVQEDDIAEPIAKTRAALTNEEWDDAHRVGRNTTVEDALRQAHAASDG